MENTDQVPVRIFASKATYADADLSLGDRVETLIRDRVLAGREAPYYEVKVKIKRDAYNKPRYLIAYLLRKDIYSVEIVRVDIDDNFVPSAINTEYSDDAEDQEEDEPPDGGSFDVDGLPVIAEGEQERSVDSVDAYAVDFVVATPCDDIPTAVQAVNAICALATAAGLRTAKLVGSQATVSAYKSHLASGVRGFVNIGHGNTSLIVLVDGTLAHSWFAGLTGRPVAPAVVYFNSCQVFNDPLKASILQSGARTFVGGIVNLLIGPSEKVCECFWRTMLSSVSPTGATLKSCEKANYPNEGAHGIGGDTGHSGIAQMRLAHAMWTHGVSVQVENPERLVVDRRYGFFARLRGKPFTSTWVHLAIPTPVIVDGVRLRAGSALVRFRTGPGATIDAVHVWDAEHRRIAAYESLKLTSGSGFKMSRFDVPMRPLIHFGVGLSLLLKFGDDVNLPPNKLMVDLSAGGLDFVLPASS